VLRVYLRLLSWLSLVSLSLIAFTLLAAPQQSGASLVYHQFKAGAGRYLVYHDPFHGLEWTTRSQAHKDAASYRDSTFAPDYQSYIAPRPTDSGVDLFVIAADRSWQRQLTFFRDFPPIYGVYDMMRSNTHPLWSPDGQWVAFISSDLNGVMDIFIIRPDGRDLRRVAHDIGSPVPLGLRWAAITP
jgi:Tol biopolymer transport system component